MGNSPVILAHVFLLQGPGQTNKALTFIIKIVTEAADDGTIDIRSVVRSCLVSLLAKLVNVLGSEDPGKAQAVSCFLIDVANVTEVPEEGHVGIEQSAKVCLNAC